MKAQSILFAIAGLGVGFILGFGLSHAPLAQAPAAPTSQVTKQASVMVDNGQGSVAVYKGDVSFDESLLQFMRALSQANNFTLKTKEYKGLGALIEQIGSTANGAGGRYWQYWVNNSYASVGADQYTIKPGDVIEWKFAPSQQTS